MTLHKFGYQGTGFFRNALSTVQKYFSNKVNPFSTLHLLQEQNISEFIKRHAVIIENIKQHVSVAAIKTITHICMPLSMKA